MEAIELGFLFGMAFVIGMFLATLLFVNIIEWRKKNVKNK